MSSLPSSEDEGEVEKNGARKKEKKKGKLEPEPLGWSGYPMSNLVWALVSFSLLDV